MAGLYNGYTNQINYYTKKANACILADDVAGFKRYAKIVHTMLELRSIVGRPVR